MKLTCVAFFIACGVAPVATLAQSSVSLYGVIDMNVERSNHRNVNGSFGNLTQLKSDGLFGSRLGFTGTEDLGGGNKALFVLEAGMAPDTGVVGSNGKFFSRLSYVGLESSLGRITLGRQYTAQFDTMSRFFPLTRAPQYEPYAQIESIYTDNSIKLTKNSGPFKMGAHYGFGESAVGSKGNENYSAGIAYEPGPWGAGISYDQTNTDYAASGTYGYVRKVYVAGRYQYKATTFYAGWRYGKQMDLNAKLTQRDDIWYIGIEQQFNPLVNGAIGYYFKDIHQTTSRNVGDPKSIAARMTYSLSKRTDIYAVAGYAKNAGLNFADLSTLQPGTTSQHAVGVGIRHIF